MEQTTINVFGAAYTVGQFIGLLVLAYYIVSAVIVLFEESVILSRHGEGGWKVLLPFYGPYLFFRKTCDNGGLYWATVISAVVAGLLYLVVPVMGEYYLLMPLFCRLLRGASSLFFSRRFRSRIASYSVRMRRKFPTMNRCASSL